MLIELTKSSPSIFRCLVNLQRHFSYLSIEPYHTVHASRIKVQLIRTNVHWTYSNKNLKKNIKGRL